MMKIISINGQPNEKLKKMKILIHLDGNMLMIFILNFLKKINLNMLEEENGLDMRIKFKRMILLSKKAH